MARQLQKQYQHNKAEVAQHAAPLLLLPAQLLVWLCAVCAFCGEAGHSKLLEAAARSSTNTGSSSKNTGNSKRASRQKQTSSQRTDTGFVQDLCLGIVAHLVPVVSCAHRLCNRLERLMDLLLLSNSNKGSSGDGSSSCSDWQAQPQQQQQGQPLQLAGVSRRSADNYSSYNTSTGAAAAANSVRSSNAPFKEELLPHLRRGLAASEAALHLLAAAGKVALQGAAASLLSQHAHVCQFI